MKNCSRALFLISISIFAAPAFGEENELEMMKGAKLAESRPPEPVIVVGANDIAGSIAEPGWPIIVGATILSAEEPPPDFPPNLRLEVTDENNAPVSITFEPIPGNDKSQFFWIASESATQNLPPGEYRIGISAVNGWSIEPGILTVEPANADHAASIDLLRIQKSLVTGHDDEALAETEEVTARDPENVDAWVAKGDILMGKDLPDEAIKAYEKALEIAGKTDDEPLFIQERHRAAVTRSLEKRGVITNSP